PPPPPALPLYHHWCSSMLLVVARGLFVACALSGFGAALFALTMPMARHVDLRLHASIWSQVRKIISLSLAAALVVGYAWLPLETHAVAGSTKERKGGGGGG